MRPDTVPPGGPLVSFCVIGAGKAGTTWLYEVLTAHPGVVTSRAKETMYFDEHYHRGVDWYHSLFPAAPEAQVIGEVSNSYLAAAPFVAPRIAAYNPEMRLVAMLRDPVDRAFSNYLFFVRNGQVKGSFEEALDQRPDILDHGFYGRNLRRVLDEFAPTALHIESFDDLQVQPTAVAERVLAHLGAPDLPIPAVAETQVLAASAPRSRAVASIVKHGAVAARRLGAPALVTKVKRSALPRYLYRPLTDRPVLAVETALQLQERYAADVDLLSALTGRDWAGLWWGERERPPDEAVLSHLPRPRASAQSAGLT